MRDLGFYKNLKDWDFSMINYIEESLTDWDMYEILNNTATSESVILDLGTGGGEKVIANFPHTREIIATDFSQDMINTAKNNLEKSDRDDIKFIVMDNLEMITPSNYFDIVVARHTCIDYKGVYNTLKDGGKLILRGVDKLDCWSLKRLFKGGQAFNDPLPISLIDYEGLMDAGFKNVELVPLHIREYYKTKEDLLALLLKTPILDNFSEVNDDTYSESVLDMDLLDKYIEENKTDKGILLIRRYYGITASK